MLGKLLKYDLLATFRFWWIAAVAFLALALFGGGCAFVAEIDLGSAFNIHKEIPFIVRATAELGSSAFVAGVSIFVIAATVMVFVRLYRNFFTDEGYLTFTLPVKRKTLLNSKIINGMVVMAATMIVVVIGFAFWDGMQRLAVSLNGESYSNLFSMVDFSSMTALDIVQFAILAIELFIVCIFAIYMHNLFIYCCGTFAAVITKKARFISAIGIYYIVSNVIGMILQLLFCFGLLSLSTWFEGISGNNAGWILIALGLCLILICWILSIFLYIAEYWMLDRKLNMA